MVTQSNSCLLLLLSPLLLLFLRLAPELKPPDELRIKIRGNCGLLNTSNLELIDAVVDMRVIEQREYSFLDAIYQLLLVFLKRSVNGIWRVPVAVLP